MTNGQIAQLQDLSKCYFADNYSGRTARVFINWATRFEHLWGTLVLPEFENKQLRSLTHLYRHQIAAVKRNQRILDGM